MTRTTAAKRASGSFNPSMNKLQTVVPSPGSAKAPRGLTKEQRKLWNAVLAMMPEEQLGTLDVFSLQELVDTWAALQSLKPQFFANPKDGQLRMSYNALTKEFGRLSMCFGLTPAHRQKLEPTASNQDTDEESKLYGILQRMNGPN